MNQTLAKCDGYIGKILEIIDSDEDLKKNLNVIITSDHGMHDIDKTHKIKLEQFIDKSLYSAYGPRSFANIFVHNRNYLESVFLFHFVFVVVVVSNLESHIDSIYKNLSTIPNYNVYKKAQIPREYHYQNNIRIGGKNSIPKEKTKK